MLYCNGVASLVPNAVITPLVLLHVVAVGVTVSCGDEELPMFTLTAFVQPLASFTVSV